MMLIDSIAADAPTLTLSAPDRERLLELANAALDRMPEVASLLLDEADRADVLPAGTVPENVVGLHSYVEYSDSESGAIQQVQIVYPHEADIAQWKISVLTLIGAGLIGLSEGQSILWPTKQGRRRTLTVLRVGATPLKAATK